MIFYENSNGVKLNLFEWPVAIQDITKLYGWIWEYSVTGNRMLKFDRAKKSRKLEISVYADDKDEFKKIMNEIHDITETDILNETPGKLWCGSYYMKCYLIEAEMQEYEEEYNTVDGEIKVETLYPAWIYEKEFMFRKSSIISSDNKIYPGKYPHRYANGLNNAFLTNNHYAESNFIMRIYGPVVKPMIIVGGYKYMIDIILEEGEYLEIDSITESITKIMTSGIRINSFHNRDKKHSVFRKIQSGRQEVSWSGKFDFDIVIYQERSEPKW